MSFLHGRFVTFITVLESLGRGCTGGKSVERWVVPCLWAQLPGCGNPPASPRTEQHMTADLSSDYRGWLFIHVFKRHDLEEAAFHRRVEEMARSATSATQLSVILALVLPMAALLFVTLGVPGGKTSLAIGVS